MTEAEEYYKVGREHLLSLARGAAYLVCLTLAGDDPDPDGPDGARYSLVWEAYDRLTDEMLLRDFERID